MKKKYLLSVLAFFVLFTVNNNLLSQSLAYKLATMEKGGYVSDNDPLIKEFSSLLYQLDKIFPETITQIGDKTYKAKLMLEEEGIYQKMIPIMKGISQKYNELKGNIDYNSIISLYVLYRLEGDSHARTLRKL